MTAARLRDLAAYLLVIHFPLPHRIWFSLLPYAGNWAYRHERAVEDSK